MTRDTRSARNLISELEAVVGHVEVDRDDLDGLGVYRTYRITSTDYKGLGDVVTAVADQRIVQSRAITNGVEVTFVHDSRADASGRFGVVDARDLLTKKRKTTKKSAAKKAVSKDAD